MNNPPNHPLYNTLGNPPNIHLLDTMFGMQAGDQHKPATIIPAQYTYQEPLQLHAPHHPAVSAMNLAQQHVVTTANEQPAQVLVYPSSSMAAVAAAQHQQQPISYKIPQMQHSIPSPSVSVSHTPAAVSVAPPISVPTPPQPSAAHLHHERKKDIMAEAASKIFEDPKKPVHIQQNSAAGGPINATTTNTPLPVAIKSEPVAGPSSAVPLVPVPTQPAITPKKEPGTGPGPAPVPSLTSPPKRGAAAHRGGGGGGGRGASMARGGGVGGAAGGAGVGVSGSYANRGQARQQVVPRLHLLEDEDDGLTCRMCLQSFWYKAQLLEHLKDTHSITDPARYEKEEREKRLRRYREDQQRNLIARRQRMARGRGRGRGGGGKFGRPDSPKITGPKPSFQYRDGAFICDLCKKSFSDGNDMVTHWKTHVKQQRQDYTAREAQTYSSRVPGKRGPGRPPGYRPSMQRYSDGDSPPPSRGRGRGRGGGLGRADKGKPRWTAYLVWSTRRRKELTRDNPDWSFAEVAKEISNEWKEVSADEKDRYQDEAEDMNERGIRKLPDSRPETSSESESDSDTSESWSESSDFETRNVSVNIKREDGERVTRQRKRPSFFQEFENEENNLDKILDEFELEQIEEAKKPKPEKKPVQTPKNPGSRRGRRRKRTPSPEIPQEPVELETSRSGRVRKKIRFYDLAHDSGEEQDLKSDEDDDPDEEFKPDSDADNEEPDEEISDDDPDIEAEVEELEEDGELPLNKRRGLMTDEEIEEATRRAILAAKANLDGIKKGGLSIIPIKKEPVDGDASGAEDNKDPEPGPSEGAADKSNEAIISEGKDDNAEESSNSDDENKTENQPETTDKTPAESKDEESSRNEADDNAEEPNRNPLDDAETSQQPQQQQEESSSSSNNPFRDIEEDDRPDSNAQEQQAPECSTDDNSAKSVPSSSEVPPEASSAIPSSEDPSQPSDPQQQSQPEPEPQQQEEQQQPEPQQAPEPQPQSELQQSQPESQISQPQPVVAPAPPASEQQDEQQQQQQQPPVQPEGVVSAEGNEDPEDLLTSSTSTSRMEEGDEKFKDIIAEGQIENMFD